MANAERQDNLAGGAAMSDTRLRAIVSREIQQAVDYIDGEIGEDRRAALDLYYGEPLGNEVEGRSAVISTDVQDTIESAMPALMEIFAGSDEIVRFEPHGPEDEESAKQATDYVTYVINQMNDGYKNTHSLIKDALLQKNGILKVYWDDEPIQKHETLENVNQLQLQELDADEDIEIIEHDVKQASADVIQFAPDGELHDVKLMRTMSQGRVVEVPIPPEEFLISRRETDLESARFTCHKERKTVSDLREIGYSEEQIDKIGSGDEEEFSEERQARFQDEEWIDGDDSYDPAMRQVWVYECYLKTDYDGDGIAEMRMVTVAGGGYEILENEEVDDHPFVSATPVLMSHKFFGRSLADLTADIQLIKTTLQRQILDNTYMINNARSAITNKVDLDDWLSNRPGQAVRVDTDAPDAAGHISPIQTTPIGNQIFPMLEYFDNVRETRTGVTRYNQGLDADSLNKTATGINQILGQAAKRLLLIARTLAETGFKTRYQKVVKLLIAHQDRPTTIRLRNKWVEMNPKSWDADMDLTISVGLGYGTKESQLMADQFMLQVMEKIIGLQGGIQGPLVKGENIYHVLKRLATNQGWKDPDMVFTDPADQPPQQPQPDPKMVEMQGKMALEEQKLKGEREKSQARMNLENAQMEADARLKMIEARFDAELERFKAENKLLLEREIADGKINMQREISAEKINLAAFQASLKADQERGEDHENG